MAKPAREPTIDRHEIGWNLNLMTVLAMRGTNLV
jgi:hypothetical protein